MMRKAEKMFACLALGLILLCGAGERALAAGTASYVLDDTGISVSLPSGYIAFTRDIDENDPNLARYGQTKEALASEMRANDIYLEAWDTDADTFLMIGVSTGSWEDFCIYSPLSLSPFTNALAEEWRSNGAEVIRQEVYQGSKAQFIMVQASLQSEETTRAFLQYLSVVAGKRILVTLRSQTGQVSPEHETMMKDLLDSFRFDARLQAAHKAAAMTEALYYEDKPTKTSFTVPANWSVPGQYDDGDVRLIVFTANTDTRSSIMYAGIEGQDASSAVSKLDIESYTQKYILSGFTHTGSDTVSYGGFDYKRLVLSKNAASDGSDATAITVLFHKDKGLLRIFQFAGPDSNPLLHADFEQLMRSVRYPVVSASDSMASPSGAAIAGSANPTGVENLLLSLLITIAVYCLPIIIYRYAIRKEPVEPKKAGLISILYGLAAYLGMYLLLRASQAGDAKAGYAVFLWSYVNYRMLKGGEKRYVPSAGTAPFDTAAPAAADKVSPYLSASGEGAASPAEMAPARADSGEPLPDTPAEGDIPGFMAIRYCRKCGKELTAGSVSCGGCGAPVQSI